ncbi:MAG: hypothetical protein ACJ73L_11240 [Actinomycetes bacterium]
MTDGTSAEAAGDGAVSRPQPKQATVHRFDASSGSGSVITDDGVVVPFSSQAWQHSRLLNLRVGQRLRVSLAGEGSSTEVTALTLSTFPP